MFVLAFPLLHYKWARIKSSIWQNRVAHQIKYAIRRWVVGFSENLWHRPKDAYGWHNFFPDFGYVYYSNTLRSTSITVFFTDGARATVGKTHFVCCTLVCYALLFRQNVKCSYTIWCDNEQFMIFKPDCYIFCATLWESFLVSRWQFNRIPQQLISMTLALANRTYTTAVTIAMTAVATRT